MKIPTGVVNMRDDRTKETWSVDIDSFQLGKFPITQDLYKVVTEENPSTFKGDRLPVETVSWIDAVSFCNTLSESLEKDKCYEINLVTESVTLDLEANGFRLPTEAEWQYACQAGNKDIRYGELSEIAWFKENSNNHTQKVGQKTPNDWGLYDMLGNVWEWCEDYYNSTSERVMKGGSFLCNDDYCSGYRTYNRMGSTPDTGLNHTGFRCVKSIPVN